MFFFSIERVSFAIGFVLISNALFLVTADVFFFLSIFGCFFFFSVRLWVIFILFFCLSRWMSVSLYGFLSVSQLDAFSVS
jgi:hypothetical protein